MLGGLPDLPTYDGRCLAEALARETSGNAELLLSQLESWVMSHGGSVERQEPPRSRGLGRIESPIPARARAVPLAA